MKDVLGRSWQMGTIQLDAQMPARFGLAFAGEDNHEHTPYVIHRALLGSLERFIGILIEHFGGDFPLWLAPEQVRVLTVSDRFAADAESLADDLRVHGFRASVDEREETLGRKIRDAELAKIPYVVVWGERESLDALAVRRRGGEQATVGWEALLSELQAAAKL
jgi:threonyl-tRNA synthetase